MNISKEFDRIKGKRPEPDYVWCDECLRWEWEGISRKNRSRINRHGRALLLGKLAGVFYNIANHISHRADLAKIRDNARRGLLIEEKPK